MQWVLSGLAGAGGILLATVMVAAARWALQARDTSRDTNHLLTELAEDGRIRDRRLDVLEARWMHLELWRASHDSHKAGG